MYDAFQAAVVGLVLLVVLWPTRSTGKRLLKSWRVNDPSAEQIDDAVRYLKRRRVLYPVLCAGLTLVPFGSGRGVVSLVAVVLGGTLLAELLAMSLPREGRQRVASLAPRGLFDVGSRYVLGGYAFVLAVALVLLLADFRIERLPVLVMSVAAVAAVMWAAVNRPSDGDEEVDRVLRTRSVHVSAGLGAAVAGALVGGLFVLAGVAAWVLMANTNVVSKKIVW
ncbi:hypothetical protein SAMN05216553_10248 [Lentzea fradiae]|uniref:Uncharacterized protein n=1 Tax=Lentzea fradiae TaxID=200378 RepID=A0A1G7M1J6_9PSEU|nr:hypothetical protein [Lentzea fradiae]SDF55504.1 hypothetical protein SAMN05216553_10248 [Lentzea fradiae]